MTLFFNSKQVLMENVSFQDLTPKGFHKKKLIVAPFMFRGK